MVFEFLWQQILLLIIATASNLLSALAGGGAGLIQLPALLFLGLPFATALATHKVATVALGLGASVRHAKSGNIEWRFAGFVLATGLPGVIFGANTALLVSETVARTALGLLTIGLGLYSLFKKELGQDYVPRRRDPQGFAISAVVLFTLGFLNGALSSGSGLFVTLWLIGWFGLDYKRATAYTLVLVGIFWNASGALTLVLQTWPQWEWLPMLLLGSLAGGFWGAHLAIAKGNPLIKKIFEGVTLLVGFSLLAPFLF